MEQTDPNIIKDPTIGNPEVNYFACTNYRNQSRKFGVKLDDRRRHLYVIGKTGMGKTTLIENMVLNDIYAGHGVCLVDPHGDSAEKIIDYIPPHRINDVVYFNPADINYPVGFNILETINPEHKHLVSSGLMGVFKKIWPDVWSTRMEYILNNTILALLDYPDTTLLGINRLLADKEYRDRVVKNLKDPVVKAFWETEFAAYNDRYKQEAVAPIQNKIGQFLSASVIRNIVAQVKSRINIREIMDKQKIFIINLSKGRIGEDNSKLLGGMLITKIQLSAMERVDVPERERKDFFLYVDEFQNFATESFANILSEARKYRLDLIIAHQYMEQLDEKVLAAVIGNVGSILAYRTGSTDAAILVKEFTPTFTEEDLVNLPKFNIYLKLMIDGVSSRPFSATVLPPIGSPTGSTEKVIRGTRERFSTPREKIEEKIKRWSGIEIGGLDDEELVEPIEIQKKGEPPKTLRDFVINENSVASENNREENITINSELTQLPEKNEELEVPNHPLKKNQVNFKKEKRNLNTKKNINKDKGSLKKKIEKKSFTTPEKITNKPNWSPKPLNELLAEDDSQNKSTNTPIVDPNLFKNLNKTVISESSEVTESREPNLNKNDIENISLNNKKSTEINPGQIVKFD